MGSSRLESFLEVLNGETGSELPTPQSRVEELLLQLIENGGGGGSSSSKYMHRIKANFQNTDAGKTIFFTDIINDSDTPLTGENVYNYFSGLGKAAGGAVIYPCTGSIEYESEDVTYIGTLICLKMTRTGAVTITFIRHHDNAIGIKFLSPANFVSVVDTVYSL